MTCGGLYRPAGGSLPRVEMGGLSERLGLKDLTLDRGVVEVEGLALSTGVVEVEGLALCTGGLDTSLVRGEGTGDCSAVVSSVVGPRSHWELLTWQLRRLSDSDLMELAVLS